MRKIARFAVLSLLVAAAAQADIIYDNGGTLLEGGLLSNEAVGFIVADNFVLEEGANVLADIHWWGHYFHTDALPDDFTVYIFADAGGSPGDVLHTFTDPVLRTDTGDDTFGVFSEYEYHMDITPVELTAGTTYWVAIQNNIPNCDWYWSISDFAEGDAHQKLTAWENQEVEMAFNLTGNVTGAIIPEPATLSLMAIGLVGLTMRRKFAKN